MDTLTAIGNRRSARRFKKQPVARAILEKLVDAARLAPTARNDQPWEFVVLTDRKTIEDVADLTDHGKFLAEAPACIAVFCQNTKYYLEDGCAATENILLAATTLNVQSCWIAGDKKLYAEAVAARLGAPPKHRLVSLLALGYADGEVRKVPKRSLDRVIHWEKF